MKKNKLLYNPDNDWREPVSDFIENGVVKRIKKPKKVDWGFVFFTLVLLLLIGVSVCLLVDRKVEKTQPTIQAPGYFMAKINNEDAIVWKSEEGVYSARVRYKKCYDVATIKGWVNYCDREIINVKWE